MAGGSPREMPERKKGRLKACPPGAALSFIPWAARGRKSIPILTQTGKQKPSDPLQALPPCPALPVPTACHWRLVLGAQNPRTPRQAAEVGEGGQALAPAPVRPGRGLPTATLGPRQGPSAVPATEATTSTQGSKPQAPALPTAEAAPQVKGTRTQGSKGGSEAAWRTPRAPRRPGRPAPPTVPALFKPTPPASCPRTALAWEPDRCRAPCSSRLASLCAGTLGFSL